MTAYFQAPSTKTMEGDFAFQKQNAPSSTATFSDFKNKQLLL